MQYRTFGKTGEQVSVLGYGCMRFPEIEDEKGGKHIDRPRAMQMLRHAIDSGVNYVDTAYFYHNGESELTVGEALQDGYREKTLLATKLPMGNVHEEADFDRLLNEQLHKLQTDHIDFYLCHALNNDHWENCFLKFNIGDKLKKAKEEGRIRHIGFSFHDDLSIFYKIIDGFDAWEFCQIQFSYMDTDYQAGLEGLRYAASKNLGVVVMEPLQGGALANPDAKIREALQGENPVEAALNYIWNYPEVSLLLSGMSAEEQVEQNLQLADKSKANALTEEQLARLQKAKEIRDALALVPCRDCKYCIPCPNGVDIPAVFRAWNEGTKQNNRRVVKEIFPLIEEECAKCIKCGACESKCPQQIAIIKELHKVRCNF